MRTEYNHSSMEYDHVYVQRVNTFTYVSLSPARIISLEGALRLILPPKFHQAMVIHLTNATNNAENRISFSQLLAVAVGNANVYNIMCVCVCGLCLWACMMSGLNHPRA